MSQLLFWLTLVSGLTGKIQGVVKDEATGQPIPYADVVITNTEIGTATDDQGNFFILNIPLGKYTVEISCLGYQTKKIENIIVEIDQTVRLNVSLKPSAIEMAPVVISGTTPSVEKDMVGSTYIIRKVDLEKQPIDYFEKLISFQPSVANLDTALHVRGGRATEVLYLIDNVSIIDPLSGEPVVNIAKGVIDEVIFMPGGFDAEYGRAMSGVVNVITEHPQDYLAGRLFAKTETIMPTYYDFGYQDYQVSAHLPASKRFKGLVAADLMHTNDYDPRLYLMPHKQRDDYSVYGKWIATLSPKINLTLSGAQSRSQFDRWTNTFKYHLDHWRSDLRQGDFEALNINFLPDAKALITFNLNRLATNRTYGVREPGSDGPFVNFMFRPYNSIRYPIGSYTNPFGVYFFKLRVVGDYPVYQNNSSQVLKAKLNSQIQVNKYNELKAGFEYAVQDFGNFTYILSNDTLRPITDQWDLRPVEYSAYIQDNFDYEGLYLKVGGRYDYFSNQLAGIKPKIAISPRIGFSFLVTEKFLFRANIGKYVQPPPYDKMYQYLNYRNFPSYIEYLFANTGDVVGNPDLAPEKTMSYEIGMQGEIKPNMNLTVNAFYKDVSDLLGILPTQGVSFSGYYTYHNVEYANIKGLETILDVKNKWFTGKLSYTLSWTRGTSSYAEEWADYYLADTGFIPPTHDFYLAFDQRHRIFIQGTINLPAQAQFHIFGYLGNGFPYTPAGLDNDEKIFLHNAFRMPFRRQFDGMVTKTFRFGRTLVQLNLEALNLLDLRYELGIHGPWMSLDDLQRSDYYYFIDIHKGQYNPAADFNHDGMIQPPEYYKALTDLIKDGDAWFAAYSSPRRARLGITVSF